MVSLTLLFTPFEKAWNSDSANVFDSWDFSHKIKDPISDYPEVVGSNPTPLTPFSP